MTASTTSFNACTDPYNEDLQADQLTLSISVHRAAAPERVVANAGSHAPMLEFAGEGRGDRSDMSERVSTCTLSALESTLETGCSIADF